MVESASERTTETAVAEKKKKNERLTFSVLVTHFGTSKIYMLHFSKNETIPPAAVKTEV